METYLTSSELKALLAGGCVAVVIPQLRLADRDSPLQEWNGFAALSLLELTGVVLRVLKVGDVNFQGRKGPYCRQANLLRRVVLN